MKNSSIENDKRDDFDDINFEIIFAQNICFFDIANKINEIKINKKMKKIDNEINDEIKKNFENIYENVFDETNNANSLNINCTSFF